MKVASGMSADADARRARLIKLCCSFPEAKAERAGATHIAFKVRKKVFAYYALNHHGDGIVALWCKAPPGHGDRLVSESPGCYFVPPYLGSKGWIALRLDTARLDWAATKELAFGSYSMVAPAGLRLSSGTAGPDPPAGLKRGRRARTESPASRCKR